jgi:hypothetical protein
LTDTGCFAQSRLARFIQYNINWPDKAAKTARRVAVRLYAIRISALLAQDLRGFIKPAGNLQIESVDLRRFRSHWPRLLTGQLFFEVFTSKKETRRTTRVLLQLGHLMGLIFLWYLPKENMSSKFRSHF